MDRENEMLSPISIESVARFSVDKTFDSEKFIKMELLVMHDKKNLNNCSFDEKGMKAAKSSIYNIPILGYVTKDKDGNYDFNGHNRHIEVQKNKKKKIVYDELPIGLVPESAKYEIVDIDNYKWVKTECFIWKDYSNYAEDIIIDKKEIPLSMEIFADKFTYDQTSKDFDISNFRYRAITFLGNSSKPAMGENSGSKVLDFSKETNDILANMKELLNKELESYEKGGSVEMENKDEKVEQLEVVEEHTENETVVEEIPSEEMTAEDAHEDNPAEEVVEHSVEFATYKEKSAIIRKGVNSLGMSSNEIYINYYLMDLDEKYVYLNKNVDKKENGKWNYKESIVRKEYTIDGNVVAFGDQETEMVMKLITVEESQEIEKQREEKEKVFVELKSYKEEKEKEIRIANEEKLFEQFDTVLGNSDKYVALKGNAENYTIEELEDKCYSLAGRMSFSTPTKNAKGKNQEHVIIDFEVEEENYKSRSPYGQAVDKYYE